MSAGDSLGQQFSSLAQRSISAHGIDPHWQSRMVEATMPVEHLKRKVMKDPDIHESFGNDFDAYHKWYMEHGSVPMHKERWPIVLQHPDLESSLGPIEDGWHRFHSYVAQGDKTIPVLKFIR